MSFMTLAVGCSSVKDNTPDAFEDYPTFDGEWNEMTYSPAETRFQVWAPTASEARVLLYEKGEGGSTYRMITMKRNSSGVWTASVEGDLKGKFYTFNVKIGDMWQGDTPGVMAKAVGVMVIVPLLST